jgi:hypothetical protein
MNKKARTRKFSAKQSARLGAYLSAGVAASVAASSEADAAVVFFDVDPSQTIGAGQNIYFGDINLAAGIYNLNDTDSPSFGLSFSGLGTSLYNGSGGGSIEWGLAGSRVAKLSYGATIDSTAITSWDSGYDYLTSGGTGPWTGGANAYAALRIDAGGGNFNYGWVSINYDTAGPTATISGFAFENQVNTPITAGAVPEPSTYALLALAGLFGAAVWHHRRQQTGGAPSELLQFASGVRGVEQLRAERKS